MLKLAALTSLLKSAPIVPVLTVARISDAAPLARALVAGGITAAEITLRTDAALDAIRAMKQAAPDLAVGAGTVLTEGDVSAVERAGADFIVTPGTSPALIAALLQTDLIVIPGISSASEAMARLEEGFGVQKFFPAEAAGGAPFLKSLAGPLPQIRFMPTGGISAATAPTYLALPNVVAIGGSWIASNADIAAADWAGITARAAAACRLATA